MSGYYVSPKGLQRPVVPAGLALMRPGMPEAVIRQRSTLAYIPEPLFLLSWSLWPFRRGRR